MIDNTYGIIRDNLKRQDICGSANYTRWYKPFDEEKRILLIPNEGSEKDGYLLNDINWEERKAVLSKSNADYRERDFSWCHNIVKRIEQGYELEFYIKKKEGTYCQINYKKFLFVNGVFTFFW